MRKLAPRASARCSPHAASADTLVTNVNGIQVGADGKLQHFSGLLIGDDGKVRQLLPARRDRPRYSMSIDGAGGR